MEPTANDTGLPRLDRRDYLWLVALIALVLLFFYQFVFLGLIPINADWLQSNFEPGRSALAVGNPHNLELDDPVYQFYPLRMEAVRQWRSGHVPLWNPGILCGSPLLADGISKPFDPLILTQIIFGGPVGLGLELLLQFILMSTGMYLLARALSIAPAGAAAAVVIYTFNLLCVTWMELRTATGTFAFFLWAFLFLFAAIEERRLRYAAIAGLFAGIMVLSGHPQFTLYAFVLLAAFVIWRAVAEAFSGSAHRALATIGLGLFALLLGAALSAVETIPFLELIRHSARSPQQYAASNAYAVPVSFLTYFYPNLFGNPARGAYLGAMVLQRSYMTAAIGFTGASTLAFVIAALFLGRAAAKRFFIALWVIVPVLILAIGEGFAGHFPAVAAALSSMDLARAVFMSNFAVAILAGMGVAALGSVSWDDVRFQRLAVILPSLFVVIVAATLAAPRVSWHLFFESSEQMGIFRLVMSQINSNSGSILFWPGVYVPLAFFAAAVALIFLSADLKKVVAGFAAALVAIELILAGIDYNPFVPAKLIAPDFACVNAVKAAGGDGRILGVDTPPSSDPAAQGHNQLIQAKGDFLLPNTATLYGLRDIRGDESLILDRYFRYMQRVAGERVSLLADIHLPVYRSRFIDALNVRYFMSAAPLEGDDLKLVFSDGKSFVYENPNVLPRVWLVNTWLSAPSPLAALNLMHSLGDFDPLKSAVIDSPSPVLSPSLGGLPPASASIVYDSPSRIEIAVASSGGWYLILSDSYYPGWIATIDGVPAPILPADCALRAVRLPAGAHKVAFRYLPASFLLGSIVSLTSCLILALTAIFSGPRLPKIAVAP